MQTNVAGQVVLELKTLWRDGTTHLVMSPLECRRRVAVLDAEPSKPTLAVGRSLRYSARSAGLHMRTEPPKQQGVRPVHERLYPCGALADGGRHQMQWK